LLTQGSTVLLIGRQLRQTESSRANEVPRTLFNGLDGFHPPASSSIQVFNVATFSKEQAMTPAFALRAAIVVVFFVGCITLGSSTTEAAPPAPNQGQAGLQDAIRDVTGLLQGANNPREARDLKRALQDLRTAERDARRVSKGKNGRASNRNGSDARPGNNKLSGTSARAQSSTNTTAHHHNHHQKRANGGQSVTSVNRGRAQATGGSNQRVGTQKGRKS
jgi:hypothetical protein